LARGLIINVIKDNTKHTARTPPDGASEKKSVKNQLTVIK
jgi:hypothetical protein